MRALKRLGLGRWLFLCTVSVSICLIMIWPSKDTLIGAVSGFFGGKESTDAIGHGMLFTVFGLVWWWALRGTATEPLRTAILLTLIAGTTTEIVQMIVPSRGLSATDLIANVSGPLVLLAAQSLFRLLKRIRRHDAGCEQRLTGL